MVTPSTIFRQYGRTLSAALLLFAICTSGCSTVYSPFASLPAAPLGTGQGAISATANILPETRPEGRLPSQFASPGGELLVRYGFSDRVTLQARTWSRLNESLSINGVSIDGLYLFSSRTAPVRYGMQARALMMFDGQELVGRAALLSGVAWLPDLWIVKPYVGLGGGIGDYIGEQGANTGARWGYALINNIGGNIELFGDFSANLELVNLLQVNRYDDAVRGMLLLPSISLVWSF